MSLKLTCCICVGPKDFKWLLGLPTPVGLLGAGKIESSKISVEPSPGDEDVSTVSDTSEHLEKYIVLWPPGLLFGHAGHEEGG